MLKKNSKVIKEESDRAIRLKKLRNYNSFNLKTVAQELDLSQMTISRYESAEITNIPINNLKKLAELYKVSPQYLMGWKDSNYNDTLGGKLKNLRKFKGLSREDFYNEIFYKFLKNNKNNEDFNKKVELINILRWENNLEKIPNKFIILCAHFYETDIKSIAPNISLTFGDRLYKYRIENFNLEKERKPVLSLIKKLEKSSEILKSEIKNLTNEDFNKINLYFEWENDKIKPGKDVLKEFDDFLNCDNKIDSDSENDSLVKFLNLKEISNNKKIISFQINYEDMTEEEKNQIIGEIAEYSEYINSKFLKRRKARENNI